MEAHVPFAQVSSRIPLKRADSEGTVQTQGMFWKHLVIFYLFVAFHYSRKALLHVISIQWFYIKIRWNSTTA